MLKGWGVGMLGSAWDRNTMNLGCDSVILCVGMGQRDCIVDLVMVFLWILLFGLGSASFGFGAHLHHYRFQNSHLQPRRSCFAVCLFLGVELLLLRTLALFATLLALCGLSVWFLGLLLLASRCLRS